MAADMAPRTLPVTTRGDGEQTGRLEGSPPGGWLSRGLAAAVLSLIRFYRRFISPGLRPRCRFLPTCSCYAEEALVKHGLGRGLARTAWRLVRCHPLARGGYDPP